MIISSQIIHNKCITLLAMSNLFRVEFIYMIHVFTFKGRIANTYEWHDQYLLIDELEVKLVHISTNIFLPHV